MKKILSILAVVFALTNLQAQQPDPQQQQHPQLNQFQVFSMAYGMCFGKAIELTEKQNYNFFLFRNFEFKMQSDIEMELSDSRKIKGKEISYTFKPEEIPMLKDAKLSFKIVAFNEKPYLDPPAIDVNAFLEMMRSVQGAAEPVEGSKVEEVASLDQLKSLIKSSKQPLYIDFYSETCPPCKMLAPTFDQASIEFGEKVHFIRVNIDTVDGAGQEYGIQSIPTLIIFEEGSQKETQIGLPDILKALSRLEQ